MNLQHYILKIELDEKLVLRRQGLIELERAAAIRDILEQNHFSVIGNDHGPYYLRIAVEGSKLHLRVRDCLRHELPDIIVSLGAFRKLIKDYFLICESFQTAHVAGDRARIETVDMARRALHDEGAVQLRHRLSGQVDMDHDTARAIFTLICVLNIGAVQPW